MKKRKAKKRIIRKFRKAVEYICPKHLAKIKALELRNYLLEA